MKKTNDLKKGTRVLLRNGWEATLIDNRKGNTRLAEVYGYCTEMGSVYSHDIMAVLEMDADGKVFSVETVEHTPAQLACLEMNRRMFG